MDPNATRQLAALISRTPWLMQALRLARGVMHADGVTHWCISAGAVRNLVWERLHGRDLLLHQLADIDLVHHTPGADADLDARCAQALQASSTSTAPRWEVVNQALVHQWPGARPGMTPHADLCSALASWPETATAVGVWMDSRDELHLIAPYGVDDLMEGVLRASPGADPGAFAKRLQSKGFMVRWPSLQTPPQPASN